MTDEPTALDPEPTIPHAYLTDGSGAPLKFYRVCEGEKCPLCSKGAKGSPVAVLQETYGQETVHCLKCDWHETRRPKRGPANFRPMNSGPR